MIPLRLCPGPRPPRAPEEGVLRAVSGAFMLWAGGRLDQPFLLFLGAAFVLLAVSEVLE